MYAALFLNFKPENEGTFQIWLHNFIAKVYTERDEEKLVSLILETNGEFTLYGYNKLFTPKLFLAALFSGFLTSDQLSPGMRDVVAIRTEKMNAWKETGYDEEESPEDTLIDEMSRRWDIELQQRNTDRRMRPAKQSSDKEEKPKSSAPTIKGTVPAHQADLSPEMSLMMERFEKIEAKLDKSNKSKSKPNKEIKPPATVVFFKFPGTEIEASITDKQKGPVPREQGVWIRFTSRKNNTLQCSPYSATAAICKTETCKHDPKCWQDQCVKCKLWGHNQSKCLQDI